MGVTVLRASSNGRRVSATSMPSSLPSLGTLLVVFLINTWVVDCLDGVILYGLLGSSGRQRRFYTM